MGSARPRWPRCDVPASCPRHKQPRTDSRRLWLREEGRAVLIARTAAIQAVPSGLEAGATSEVRIVRKWHVPGSSCAATICHPKGQKRQNALSREVIESKGQRKAILHTKAERLLKTEVLTKLHITAKAHGHSVRQEAVRNDEARCPKSVVRSAVTPVERPVTSRKGCRVPGTILE